MELKTHLKIDQKLSGKVIELKSGYSKVLLKTTDIMRADERGLVHGGFIFSAADFSAMSAVNDEFVVLGSSCVRFIAPVVVGDEVIFEATLKEVQNKKHIVDVIAKVKDKEVFSGEFVTFVLDSHILEPKK